MFVLHNFLSKRLHQEAHILNGRTQYVIGCIGFYPLQLLRQEDMKSHRYEGMASLTKVLPGLFEMQL